MINLASMTIHVSCILIAYSLLFGTIVLLVDIDDNNTFQSPKPHHSYLPFMSASPGDIISPWLVFTGSKPQSSQE